MPDPADPLFRPFSVGSLRLPNRVVMAPMTRSRSPDGVPGRDVAAYYARRAAHGVGLILTEGAYVDHPAAGGDPDVPRLYGAAALRGWEEVVHAVHAAGGRIIPQLWHMGPFKREGDRYRPEVGPASPSGLFLPDVPIGAPMDSATLRACVDAYAAAARTAWNLGFDGIELHGGHGFLIDAFLWQGTNTRGAPYGGSPAARARFAVEVVQACRAQIPSDFPLFFRWSQWKGHDYTARLADTPEALGELLRPIAEAGVDVFDCSTRRYWEPAFPGSPVTVAGWTRALTGRPTVAVGSVGLDADIFAGTAAPGAPPSFVDAGLASLEGLWDRLADGEFDLVAVGRALLADPAWASKVRAGHLDQLTPFTRDVLERLW